MPDNFKLNDCIPRCPPQAGQVQVQVQVPAGVVTVQVVTVQVVTVGGRKEPLGLRSLNLHLLTLTLV